MRGIRRLCVVGLTFALSTLGATSASAAPHSNVCSGTLGSPGVLVGTYAGNVTVEGACAVNAGAALVKGNLTVGPGAALVAAFGLNDALGSGSSSLTVKGNLNVLGGATVVLGCDPQSFPCVDDPNPESPTLSSPGRVAGNLFEQQSLGVVMHNSTVSGNVQQSGGGGGLTCEPIGVFGLFQSPVYSTYEDSTIRGNLEVTGVTSCWLGIARANVSGNVRLVNDQFADPDAIEVISNQIAGNLTCQHNSRVWDSADEGEALYPRAPEPNTVHGVRSGQCVLASPATEGGPLGPGPF